MTTPAVDTTDYRHSPFDVSIGFVGKPPFNSWTDNPGGCRAAHAKKRPASGNADRLGSFLLCRPWSHSGYSFSFPNDRAEFVYPDGTYWRYSGGIADPKVDFLKPPDLPGSNLQNYVLTEALQLLKDQKFHVGNFIAESREALETVISTSRKIAMGVRRFRKIHPKLWPIIKALEGNTPRWNWCNIPQEWLALQYGWKPLLSDLYGALLALTGPRKSQFPFVTVEARRVVREEVILPVPMKCGGVLNVRCADKYVAKVVLVYGLSSPVLAELSSLGLVNPAEIVWEKLRYSFVVDWLLPVGSWLSSLTADVGYDFISGTQTLVSERIPMGSMGYSTSSPERVRIPPSRVPSGKAFNFQRNCYPSSPVPGLYVKNPLSAIHVANAMSLLVEAFR